MALSHSGPAEWCIHLPFSRLSLHNFSLVRFRIPCVPVSGSSRHGIKKVIAFAAAALLAISAGQSSARDYLASGSRRLWRCGEKVVRETGGQLLSAQPSKDGQSCIVTVLVQGSGERPRKVTVRVADVRHHSISLIPKGRSCAFLVSKRRQSQSPAFRGTQGSRLCVGSAFDGEEGISLVTPNPMTRSFSISACRNGCITVVEKWRSTGKGMLS